MEQNPYLSFRFLVEIQGSIVGGFSEVSGLEAKIQEETIKAGSAYDYVHKFPKKTKHANMVLRRGIIDSGALWEWHQDVVKGNINRKSGFIVLLDSEGNEKRRWHFIDAYPVKWCGPELKANGNIVAVESLELAHSGIDET